MDKHLHRGGLPDGNQAQAEAIPYFLSRIHHRLIAGKESVERIYPTVGINAFNHGDVFPTTHNHMSATT